jgi:hypothetical protein
MEEHIPIASVLERDAYQHIHKTPRTRQQRLDPLQLGVEKYILPSPIDKCIQLGEKQL